MAMPALKIEETVVGERVARLEANVENIGANLLRLESKVDVGFQRLDNRIDRLDHRLSNRIDGLDNRIDSLEKKMDAGFAESRIKIDEVDKRLSGKIDSIREEISSAKIWALGLYIALAGGMLYVLARGFKWI